MKILKLQNWLSKFSAFLLLLSFSLFKLSCKKADIATEKNLSDQAAFDNTQVSSQQVKRVINEFNKRNTNYKFKSSFSAKYGEPLWDKAIIPSISPTKTSARGSSGNDTTVIIPVLKPNTQEVQTYIEANLSDTVQLSVHTANQYRSLQFSNSTTSVNQAEKLAIRFMLLNKEVFNYALFNITDKRLFHGSLDYGDTAKISRQVSLNANNNKLNSANSKSARYVEVCVNIITTYNHCPYPGTCLGDNGSCDHCTAICETRTTNTICDGWWEDDSGGSGGGSGSGDAGTGGGGSGGGGTGGSGTTPCDPGEILRGKAVPCDGTGGGWEPAPGPVDVTTYSDPQTFQFYSDPNIDLDQMFNCFNNVSDIGATYTIKLCADIPVNNHPNFLVNGSFSPGHSFITVTKTNGGSSVTQSFGFYPINGVKSINMQSQDSKMNNNGNHEYDASILVPMSATQFYGVLLKAKQLASNQYDLNNFNCTDYAVEVFNVARPGDPIIVPDWYGTSTHNYGTTPNGLYYRLKELAPYNSNVNMGTANAPTGSGICP